MAKTPRKGASAQVGKRVSNKNTNSNSKEINKTIKNNKQVIKIKKASNKNRRFSIISDDSSDDEKAVNLTSSSENDNDSDDSSSDSDDSDDSDDEESNTNRIILNQAKRQMDAIISSGESDGDSDSEESGSSSDDEGVDFVQLTKERRAKAMKAAKALKKPRKSTKKEETANGSDNDIKKKNKPKNKSNDDDDSSSDEEDYDVESIQLDDVEELDDDVVDAVLEKEEKKMDSELETSSGSSEEDYDSSSDDNEDSKAEDKDVDFRFDFDKDGNDGFEVVNAGSKPKVSTENIVDEDIGEEVEIDLSKDANTLISNELITMDVPKFDDKEIDSDADYEFDQDDLIQTLQNDNDDLEMQTFGNSDDDYDFLLPNDDPFYEDDNYLLKAETDALVNDYHDYSSSNVTPRHSVVDLPDGFSDRADSTIADGEIANDNTTATKKEIKHVRIKDEKSNKVKYLPAPESQDDYVSNDDDEEDEDFNDFDISGYDDIFSNDYHKFSSKRGTSIVPINAIASEDDEDDDEEEHESDDNDEDEDSSGEGDLIQYFFSNSESTSDSDSEFDNGDERTKSTRNYNTKKDQNSGKARNPDSGDETDEDLSLPIKTSLASKKIGIKRAKEVLSSSRNNFRAPTLGTFITSKNKKPFGIIDGFSTRFLHPNQDNRTSIMKGGRIYNQPYKRSNPVVTNPQGSNQTPMALDELLNISEFEDNDDDEPSIAFEWDSFNEKRIPLSAFRNKGIIHHNLYSNYDATRKYSFGDHRRKSIQQISGGNSNNGNSKSNPRRDKKKQKTSASNSTENGVKKSKKKRSKNSVSKRDLFNLGDEFIIVNSGGNTKSLKKPKQTRMPSKKAKLRRQSVIEAHAEGLRTTKSGLFSEETLNDVEALLVDIGTGDDLGFLFGVD